jgi:hypothetical protein
MKPLSALVCRAVVASLIVTGFAAGGPHPALAAPQSPAPPVGGTMALEGTMNKFYKAAHEVVLVTADGVEHVYHFAKGLVVHGAKGPDPLADLKAGTTIVVHYTVNGGQAAAQEIDVIGGAGLKVGEGVVIHVDHGRKQITIRLDNGRTETLQLTDRAAAEAGGEIDQAVASGSTVVVYYVDQSGRRVVHYFKKVS